MTQLNRKILIYKKINGGYAFFQGIPPLKLQEG